MYPPWHSWPRGSPHRPTRMAGLTQGGASSPSTLSRARPLRSVAASPVSSVWLFSVACALHSRLQPLGDYRLSRRCSLPRGYQTGVQLLVRGSAGDVAGTGTPLSSVPPTPPSPPLPRRTGRLPLRTLLPPIARKFSADKDEKPRVLITGGLGQLGSGLARIMRCVVNYIMY